MKLQIKETLKIYWQHIRNYKLVFFVGVISLTLAIVIHQAIPLFYKWFFDVISGANPTDEVVEVLILIILGVAAVNIVSNAFWRVAEWSAIYQVTRVVADLANTCFEYMHRNSYSFFANNFAGSLVKKVNRFYRSYNRLFDAFYWQLWGTVLRIVVPIIVLLFINPLISLILFTWSLVFVFISFLFIRHKLKYDIPRARKDTEVTGVLADTITNALNVKLFTSLKKEKKTFGNVVEERRVLNEKAWMVNFWANIAQGALTILVEFFLIYYGIFLWQQGAFTIGDFVLVQAYFMIIVAEVWEFFHVLRNVYESLADAEEMTEVLLTPHEIKDVHGAKDLLVKKGKIQFENVTFNYHQTRQVLKKLNLEIEPGEKVAFVGPSGAGKSTIVKILLRFFDIEQGKILIDDQNISKVKHDSLLDQVSLVPQDPILFHRSLMDNIRYGNPKATDEEVFKAAKLAHAHEFINELPQGYETFVGERGIKLSGGERQRVAIARAILKDAPIIVLDEATSSLDSHSEKLIQDALQKLMKGRTTIVIAHRLSTIMAMDRIIVMQKGGILEEGSHEELLKQKGGLYKKLWELQAGGFLGE